MTIDLIDLRESNEFLNILFEKIPSLVLLADSEMRVQEINDTYQALFGKSREEALGQRCGNALGCAFAVAERKLCGETSHCEVCVIRQTALKTLSENKSADRIKLTHSFVIDDVTFERHFEFSTRHILFQGQQMVLIILYDVTDLENQQAELRRKQQRIEQDLQAAGTIQQCLLPTQLAASERVAFAWKFLPCDAVGGDILNVSLLDADHFGMYMLDVAGHGPPSAMISVLVYQLMNPHTGILLDTTVTPPRIREPKAVLDILEREFPLHRFGRHFTIIYMVLDLTTGRLDYSNAAQCPPLVLRQDGAIERLDPTGTIIGIDAFPLEQGSVRLNPGDKVVLYSDGLIEMSNARDEFFGEERLEDLLRAKRDAAPEALVQELFDAALRFGEGQSPADDLSILAFEYKGEA